MTAYQKELEALSNEMLVGRFDSVVTVYTHECNSRRGLTKKTEKEYELVKAELLKRMEG